MDIILSNSSDKPIYEQIASQVKAQILSGVLTAGAKLPSIRALASDLGVSVITTKRAYADLEQLESSLFCQHRWHQQSRRSGQAPRQA